MSDDPRSIRIRKTLTRVQEAAHERFRHRPGTEAHEDAVETEIDRDRELDDVLREEATGRRQDG